MTYQYRVTLSGIKGFYRVYKVSSENTLYSFHKQMRADMGFPQDQLILFKALDNQGNTIARYGLFDLGDGTVDTVSIADTIKKEISSFVYFYDVKDKKSVNISFEGEIPVSTESPTIIDSKGPDPIEFENGYVAFEDLPEDKRRLPGSEDKKKSGLEAILGINLDEDFEDMDDEDDDFDEEDDDKEEEIYDESEDPTL